MAEEYDGSVVIDVEVDSKNFDKGTVDVEKAIKSLEATMTRAVEQMSKSIGVTLTEAFKSLNTEIDQTDKKVSKASNGSKSGSKSTGKYTEEYQKLADFVEQQERNLAKLKEIRKEQSTLTHHAGETKGPYTGFTAKDNPLNNPSAYKNIHEQIEHYETELNQARNAMQRLEESGRMFAQSLSQELSQIARQTSNLDFTPLDLSKYSESARQYAVNVNKANLEYAKQADKLRQLQAQLEFLHQQEQTPEVQGKITELENKIQELIVKLQQLGINAANAQSALERALSGESWLSGLTSHLKQLPSLTAKAIKGGLTRLAKGFNKVGKAASKAASKLNIFSRAQNSASKMSKKLVKQFTKIPTMLKSRVIRKFVSAIFTGITDGIKELSKVDAKFNESISTLTSRCKQLAYTIMSAFAPLIKVAAPILSRITEYVTALVDKAAQLMAALTGQSTYQRANYNYTDYAKSLDDTADSTDNLSDSTKELNKQLAAFDALNVLSVTSDDDTSKSLLDNNNALNTAPVYTEVPISFDMSNLSDRIKEAFAKGDFEDLGVELGEKLNRQIDKIDSTKIGSTIARVINSASSFAVGFLSTVHWEELTEKVTSNFNTLIKEVNAEQLGHAIAEVINTIFRIGFTFFSEFDFGEFGIKVAELLNGVIDNLDKETIANTFAEVIHSIIDFGFNFARKFKWVESGEKLAEVINTIFKSISWGDVGTTINDTVNGILNMFISFIDGLDGNKIGSSLGEMLSKIDFEEIAKKLAEILWKSFKLSLDIVVGMIRGDDGEIKSSTKGVGKNISEGILEGIDVGMGDTENWTKEHIGKPIINGSRKSLDIHSPSKVMHEQGVYVAQGLLNGISSKISEIKNQFKDIVFTIQNAFNDTPDWLKEKFQNAWTEIKAVFNPVGEFFNGIWSTIKSKFTVIGTQIGEAIGGTFKNSINAVLETVENGINFVPNTINGAIDYINAIPGVDIPPMSTIRLPRLATGTVVPANYGEFAAILGDNKRETEVVSPLSTMKQAMIEALAEVGLTGGNNDGDIVINIDGREIFRVTKKEADKYKRMHGKPAFS